MLDAVAAEFRPTHCEQPKTDPSVDAAAAVLRGWRAKARHMPEFEPLVEAVLRHPVLRHFYPVTSHHLLSFNRCVLYPYARAVDAFVWPLFRHDEARPRPSELTGTFGVETKGQQHPEPVSPARAIELIEPHVPPDWSPAVYGTAAALAY